MSGERIKATLSAHALLVDESAGQGGNRLLLVRLAYRDHRSRKWAFPGGFVDDGESLDTALTREVQEEIGVRMRAWQQVEVVPFLEQERPHVGFLFRCTQWEGEPVCLSRELEELAWFDEASFWQMCQDGGLAYPEMCQQVACLGWRCREQEEKR